MVRSELIVVDSEEFATTNLIDGDSVLVSPRTASSTVSSR